MTTSRHSDKDEIGWYAEFSHSIWLCQSVESHLRVAGKTNLSLLGADYNVSATGYKGTTKA